MSLVEPARIAILAKGTVLNFYSKNILSMIKNKRCNQELLSFWLKELIYTLKYSKN